MDYEEFYAERVANFDKERKIFHEYSSKILPDKQEKHTLDWETRRLEDEATNNKIEYDNLNSELEQIKLEISLAKDEVEQLNKSKGIDCYFQSITK